MTEEAADINGHVTAAFVSGARLLDAETVRELSRLSPIRAPLRIVLEYTVIACAVVLFWQVAEPRTGFWLYPLFVVLIGSRMNAIGIVAHDGAHCRLHPNRRVNDFIGEYVASWPLLFSMRSYRTAHTGHHRLLNTSGDPDYVEKSKDAHYWACPRSRYRSLRLFAFDILGLHFYKYFPFLRNIYANPHAKKASTGKPWIKLSYYAVCAALITWLGGWRSFWLFWLVPIFTWVRFCLTMRTLCDHMAIPPNAWQSRTLLPPWWGRLLVAPCNISLHTEHHLFPSVPYYHLRKLHRALMATPTYREQAHVLHGYWPLVIECEQHAFPLPEQSAA